MAKAFPITIYHNPKCGTSRGVIEIVEAAGYKPEVVEYLKIGWTKPQLQKLFADAKLSPREAMRANVAEAEALGLLDAKASDAKILAAMIAHPILVNRPFVVTPKGVLLARPKERVKEVL